MMMMTMVMVLLLFSLLHYASGCRELHETQLEIRSDPGKSVLLPCSCTDPQEKPVSMRWITTSRRARPGHWIEVSNRTETYRGRVQMFHHRSPGNLSLFISDVTLEDSGFYRCEINQHIFRDMKLIAYKVFGEYCATESTVKMYTPSSSPP